MGAGSPGSSMKDIAPMSADASPLPYWFRYAPHSNVWMEALMPTADRSAWIASAIVFGDCMPDPDSGIQNVALNPLGYPASRSSPFAFSGSYVYFLTCWEKAQAIAGGIGPAAGVHVPFRTSRQIASLLIA